MTRTEVDFETFAREKLREPASAIAYTAGLRLREMFGEQEWLQQRKSGFFDLREWAEAHDVSLEVESSVHQEYRTGWNDSAGELDEWPANVWMQLDWRGAHFDVVRLTWFEKYRSRTRYFIVGPDRERVEALSAEVGRWSARIRDEILVFRDGCWHKDADLYEQVSGTSLDDLVLRPSFKQEIVGELRRFFSSRELYDEQDVPWSRGMLFLGPAGNGKTLMLKALTNELDVPSLYVRDFASHRYTPQALMHEVFDRARETAPCLLIFEDLDNLITPDNRSFFLNELDGFALNRGILTIATTNHPERLDPALLHRPSRFDRKFTFGLPDDELRRAYLRDWLAGLSGAPELSEESLDELVVRTEGFTFAYLEELTHAAHLECLAGEGDRRDLDAMLVERANTLNRELVDVEEATR